ncbi:outer membrane protein assembly factor BamD [Aliifodinibius salipaludis]|uniref:Outer membrane protein assembly factor BamD n=1 Tax=Fodinibius salipaludis TaxID=2032627 RepID=A0A2A2G7R2_9BACT|nr:outer membrane protein assembly factor BamD [Aliifodinibius salipaludis]PAU93796.1 outer membrane protein assembly factor BamD [Aliifodinibius salipaludis]
MHKLSTITFKLSCFLLAAFVFASCKNSDLIQRGDSLEVAYDKAMAFYEKEDYSNASKAFETVVQIARGTEYGQDAQFYLAESYYNDGRYLLAASEYERFISLFPRVERRQEAQFKEAYCYYKLSPRFKLDQGYTRTAIEKFQLYNSRFPNSEKANEAGQYISEMRTKLAKKLYHSADLYLRTDRYEAAVIYYDLTIDKYPETKWAQRALVDKIKTYNIYAGRSVASKQRERYQKAVEAYETFIQLFPNGEYRQEAEELVDEARSALAELPEEAPVVEEDEDNVSVEDVDPDANTNSNQ